MEPGPFQQAGRRGFKMKAVIRPRFCERVAPIGTPKQVSACFMTVGVLLRICKVFCHNPYHAAGVVCDALGVGVKQRKVSAHLRAFSEDGSVGFPRVGKELLSLSGCGLSNGLLGFLLIHFTDVLAFVRGAALRSMRASLYSPCSLTCSCTWFSSQVVDQCSMMSANSEGCLPGG